MKARGRRGSRRAVASSLLRSSPSKRRATYGEERLLLEARHSAAAMRGGRRLDPKKNDFVGREAACTFGWSGWSLRLTTAGSARMKKDSCCSLHLVRTRSG